MSTLPSFTETILDTTRLVLAQLAETSRRKKAEYERQQTELIAASPPPSLLQSAL